MEYERQSHESADAYVARLHGLLTQRNAEICNLKEQLADTCAARLRGLLGQRDAELSNITKLLGRLRAAEATKSPCVLPPEAGIGTEGSFVEAGAAVAAAACTGSQARVTPGVFLPEAGVSTGNGPAEAVEQSATDNPLGLQAGAAPDAGAKDCLADAMVTPAVPPPRAEALPAGCSQEGPRVRAARQDRGHVEETWAKRKRTKQLAGSGAPREEPPRQLRPRCGSVLMSSAAPQWLSAGKAASATTVARCRGKGRNVVQVVQGKQSGVRNVTWNRQHAAWVVRVYSGSATTYKRFPVRGEPHEKAEAKALHSAIAFREKLARQGKIKATRGQQGPCLESAPESEWQGTLWWQLLSHG